MTQPHDRLVRALLDDVDRMARVLDRLVDPPLPCGPVEGRLVRLREVLIDSDLRRSEPDFLFAIDDGSGAPDLIVVEHLSQQKPSMPVKALTQMSILCQDAERAGGRGAFLPSIHFVILYHGATPWSAPRELSELYARKGHTHGERTNVVLHVIDLGRFSDAELRRLLGLGATTLLVLLLNHGREEAMRHRLFEWDDLFRATVREKGGSSLLQAMVWYLYFVSDIDPEEVLAHPFARDSEETKAMVRTTAERLKEEGLREGLEEGLRKGLETLLMTRFGEISAELRTVMAAADATKLEALLQRASVAGSPADLFDDAT